MTQDPGSELPVAQATRYVKALREGGSLPAIVETEDGSLVVAKWRGAGQGAAALVAEVIAGEIARAVGLPVPRLVIVNLDEALARTERDAEIRDLLVASVGTNLGMQFLHEAFAFAPAAKPTVDGALAAKIVLFDAYVMNVDRTAKNTNLLWSAGQLWLIDHGAALYWHHGWEGRVDRPTRPFPLVREHVLLPYVRALDTIATEFFGALTDKVIHAAVAAVPGVWLETNDEAGRRAAYVAFLKARREGATAMAQEIRDAVTSL